MTRGKSFLIRRKDVPGGVDVLTQGLRLVAQQRYREASLHRNLRICSMQNQLPSPASLLASSGSGATLFSDGRGLKRETACQSIRNLCHLDLDSDGAKRL